MLAEIWKQLLNLELASVDDNLVELGGDSILTLQVVSRARQQGYQLRASQLFEHQTIAALATVAVKTTTSIASQAPLQGSADLLPIQQWFFSQDLASTIFYNQAILLEIDKKIDGAKLEKSIAAIVHQHDALRFAYQQRDGLWQQAYTKKKANLKVVDLATIAITELGQVITENCQKIQSENAISKGVLLQFVWIKTPSGESHNRLFLAIHHLLIDGVSWRILLKDLAVALNALSCLLYTSPSPRDATLSRMPSSA